MIEIKNLSKQFGDVNALKNVSLSFDGGVLGVCGPKGSGKTVLLNILSGNIPATAGEVLIYGEDITRDSLAANKTVGYLLEDSPLWNEMTATEFLTFVGEAKKIPHEKLYRQIDELIDITKLDHVKDVYVEHMSRGERKILGIAQALLGNPKIIVLDDPFSALSPKELSSMKALIQMLGEIKTVVISSRKPSQVADVSTKIAVISDGELTEFGAPDEITLQTKPEAPEQEEVEAALDVEVELEIENDIEDEDDASSDETKEGE